MHRLWAAIAGLLLALGALSGCRGGVAPPASGASSGSARQVVLVFAAASTSSALDEVKDRFQRQSGIDVRTSYAASSTLAQQIENGADADLFLSADILWADHVEKSDLVASRRNLLGNHLVIIVPADSTLSVRGLEDLADEAVKHLALGDPAAVPAGMYAKKAFQRLGIWNKLKNKVVPGADVRQALAYVESGAAEAGAVYATDAAVSKSVKTVVEIPESLTGPVRYPLLLLKREGGRASAESFYRYLGSPEAAAVFEKYGFSALHDASARP